MEAKTAIFTICIIVQDGAIRVGGHTWPGEDTRQVFGSVQEAGQVTTANKYPCIDYLVSLLYVYSLLYRAIVFVIDSSTFTKESKDVAQ